MQIANKAGFDRWKLSISAIFFLFVAFSITSQATTLIVVHPDPEHDHERNSGEATKCLLKSSRFSQKIVLMEKGGRYSFNRKGLKFERRASKGGEMTWDDSDSEIVLAGGYAHGCMLVTLLDLISQSPGLKKVEIDLDASFATYDLISREDYHSNEVVPLARMVKEFGLQKVIDGLEDELGFHSMEVRLMAIEIEFFFHGQSVGKAGDGPRLFQIHFVSCQDDLTS